MCAGISSHLHADTDLPSLRLHPVRGDTIVLPESTQVRLKKARENPDLFL